MERHNCYHASIRVLLEGTCGVNLHLISRETGISRPALMKFMAGGEIAEEHVEHLGMFVWRRINAHLLLSEEDRCHCSTTSAPPVVPSA